MPKIDITTGSGETGEMPEFKSKPSPRNMPTFKNASSIHHVGDSLKLTKITKEEKIETENAIEIEKITEIFEEAIPSDIPDKKPETPKSQPTEKEFDMEIDNEEKMQTEPKQSKKAKKKKVGKGIKTASAIFFSIFLISIIFLFTKAALADALTVLPEKILIPTVVIPSVITLLFCAITFLSKFHKVSKIIVIILEIFLSIMLFYVSFALDTVFNFLNGIQASNYQIESFYVIVKTDSEINTIEEISNKTIAIYEDTTDTYQEALDLLSEKSTAKQISYKDFVDAGTALKENNTEAMFIKGSMKETAEEIIPDFSTKIIDTIEIKTRIEQTVAEQVDITAEPFNVYISGIDTYGDISAVSRSDVNMIATINPKDNKILLTSIPRDYYVQLHDTTGLKDKLTHAGIYGISMSEQTLEDLFGIDIDYYVRVNFSTLINVIDSIGGIDITPDTTFTAWTNHACTFYANQTMHLGGDCALAYARERYAYAAGDRHRVQNQQDVISAVIDKMTSSKTLITKYSEILTSLGGSIQTNIPTSQIYKLVNLQLDRMPSWTINKTQVDGTGSMDYTYSIPSQLLYVMIPNQDTVNAAIEQINRTMHPENYIETIEEEYEEIIK